MTTPAADVGERLEWLASEHPPGRPPRTRDARIAWQREFCAVLFDHGLAGPAWPRSVGGMELEIADQIAYHEAYDRLRLPQHPGNGPGIAGPTLIAHGTPDQRERYLRPMLRADEIWAQGFSEPEAGSDLSSLRTTAVRDGDDYVVTGQKIWSSYADVAEVAFVLARTGGPASGSGGISYLLVDMSSSGVEVRPIRDLTGESRFSEIFLDEVRVPVSSRVGAENEGWPIARVTLGHERAARSLSQAGGYVRRLETLLGRLVERGQLADPVTRDRIAQLAVRVDVLQLNAIRTVTGLSRTGTPGPTASLARLELAELEQAMFECAVDLLGPDALIQGDDGVDGGRWARGLLATRGSTIGAGTSQIQRNSIAEQLLGLPRN